MAHERKHMYNVTQVCDCGMKFKSRDALRNHVKKKHLNERDYEKELNDMQENIKQKAIQHAMEKGIDAAYKKYKIGKETLEIWIMDKYVDIDDEKLDKFEKLEAELSHEANETDTKEPEVQELDDHEKSKKQDNDKSEKEREKVAMEKREKEKDQGSTALEAVKQIVDKHFDLVKVSKNDKFIEQATEQQAINQESEKSILLQRQPNNRCRICFILLKERKKAHILVIKEINHYITFHQICPLYGCGMPVRTMDNWNSHLSDSHKPKKLTKEEFINQAMKPITPTKPLENKVESSKPLKQTKRIVDLSTPEDEIRVLIKTSADGSFEIPQVAARGRSIKPATMGYSKNDESWLVKPQSTMYRKEQSQIKTLDILHPDNLGNLVASVTMSGNGVFDIKIQNPL